MALAMRDFKLFGPGTVRAVCFGFFLLTISCVASCQVSRAGSGDSTLIVMVAEPALPGLKVSVFTEKHSEIAKQSVPLVPGHVEFLRLAPGSYVIELSSSDCRYYAKRTVQIHEKRAKKIKLQVIKHDIPCE